MRIESTAFAEGGEIPKEHTCQGADQAPALAWREAPPGTKSFALIVDDPDAPDPAAPKVTWVHWVVYDIPGDANALPPSGARIGLNDWGRAQWNGPCPPIGRHRYFFKLYALDATLGDLGSKVTKPVLENAMQGHVLGKAELIGTYEKRR